MAERNPKKPSELTFFQSSFLALMRIAIGWHFAYEGVFKLLFKEHGWAGPYLTSTNWIGAEFFHWLASNDTTLRIVEMANAWGLLLVGLGLMVGCMTRLAALGGIALLALYYVAHPALFVDSKAIVEGNYLIVNKNLVELLALLVVLVMPAPRWGLDGFLGGIFRRRVRVPADTRPESGSRLPRRRMLAGLIGLPILGGFVLAVLKKRGGYHSKEEQQLASHASGADAVTSPSMKKLTYETLDDLKGKVPKAKIKDVELSRVIMGGNLMNGFAHARDLIYVSSLIKAYHEEWRVFQTLRLGEACGINTIITNPILAPQIVDYWEKDGGKIQFIAQCKGKNRQDFLDNIQFSLDHGACAAYVQGMAADAYVKQGHFDWIAEGLQKLRDAGVPAGIGGHYLETIKGCVNEGFDPDFWMKTLHHHNYWSSDMENQKDNIWCEKPDETIQFMESLPQPWIAFKVLAAGALHPRDGFRYAFEKGADFICVGMYDFQVVEDCNIALDVLQADLNRKRPWCAIA